MVITLAREVHFGRIFFFILLVSSTFGSHWNRFHSHLRSFAGVLASWKFQEPLGPNQFGSCIGNCAAIGSGTKVIPEGFQHSESISTTRFSF